MYLAQVPKTPGVHLVGIADLVLPRCARESRTRGLAARALRRAIARRGAERRHDAPRRRLAGAGRAIRRSTSSSNAPAIRSQRSSTVSRHSHQRKHVVNVTVEADAFCGPLLARKAAEAGVVYSLAYRRPAGADLRSRRLGARRRLSGGRRRARPQVAAALRAVDAGDRVGPLRPDAGAGEGRRPQSEDVQFVPRRLEAGDRDAPPCATRPGSSRRRTACSIRRRRSTRFLP